MLEFDPILNNLMYSLFHIFKTKKNRNLASQEKFERMQFALAKSPKAIFFLRVFFNMTLKLIDYAGFRAFQKCWERLLDLCFTATKNIIRDRENFVDVSCVLLTVKKDYLKRIISISGCA